MSIDIMNHPDFGSEFTRFKNEPDNVATRRGIEYSLGKLVRHMINRGDLRIDHKSRGIVVFDNTQDTILMALTQCPVDVEYDLYYKGGLIGKAVYKGITSEGGRVLVNTELVPEAPIEYINTTLWLD
jgi:hypothetical protein